MKNKSNTVLLIVGVLILIGIGACIWWMNRNEGYAVNIKPCYDKCMSTCKPHGSSKCKLGCTLKCDPLPGQY